MIDIKWRVRTGPILGSKRTVLYSVLKSHERPSLYQAMLVIGLIGHNKIFIGLYWTY
ncbi:40125_t:CDS:2, partial [Gigaspora margarita]